MLRNLCDFARSGPNYPESRSQQGIQADAAGLSLVAPLITPKPAGVPDRPGATMLGTAAERAARRPRPISAAT
ncbi:hypothetical protein CT19431_240267 [Cupriavidus taiwanensis]|nr:hypothetical protein CT19431_240267 [Cupriavidus taiwanensis]